MDFSLADMTRITGAKRRTVQHWAATGVVLADPETERGGTGVHRRFSRDEVIIACLVHAFSLDQQMSVGALLRLAKALRVLLRTGEFKRWIEEAITNKAPLYVMIQRSGVVEDGADFRAKATQSAFPKAATRDHFANIGRSVVEQLDNYGGFTAVIMANPYLKDME
jgi:hypothetical protein